MKLTRISCKRPVCADVFLTSWWRSAMAILSASLMLSGSVSASQQVDIAPKPMEKSVTVPPNIMFILDDSASMMFGWVPEDIFDWTTKITSYECNGAIQYKPYIRGYQRCRLDSKERSLDKNNAFELASSDKNKLYFDPENIATYKVPLNPVTNKPYAMPSFSSAPVDGFDNSSDKIDLSKNYAVLIDNAGLAVPDSRYNGIFSFAFYLDDRYRGERAYYFKQRANCTANTLQCYEKKVVTREQEQAFAIWFSFYRNRLMLTKSAVTTAFNEGISDKQNDFRVGYFTINQRNKISGVKAFSESRLPFFKWLQSIPLDTGGTPLLLALQAAGNYFKTADPWKDTPSTSLINSKGCRRSVAILMTDGYYNNSKGAQATAGGDDSDTKTLVKDEFDEPLTPEQMYKVKAPFKDGVANTLADIAMDYWKEDLQPSMVNNVSPGRYNYAIWQHMTTYGAALGVNGNLDFDTVYAHVQNNTQTDVTYWSSGGGDNAPNPEKIDDLMHAAVNTHGNFFSARTPSQFASGLSKLLSDIRISVSSQTSLGATSLNAITTDSSVYQASYDPEYWNGDLVAFDANNKMQSKWRASFVNKDHTKRTIYYYSLQSGRMKDFTWSNFATETVALAAMRGLNNDNTPETDERVKQRINYLRGDQSLESSVFRRRGNSIIGDIVNSDPVLVDSPIDLNYQRFTWGDGYRTYLNEIAKVDAMIYTSANDGMLHAFDAKTGKEVFAYIPQSVFKPQGTQPTSLLYHYSSRDFYEDRKYLLDSPNVVADVQINNTWTKVLIGGSGRGGKNIFALDITNPKNPKLLWDIEDSIIGNQIGKPKVVRLDDNKWYLLYGSGFNNSLNSPALIMVNLETGEITPIKAKVGSASNKGSATDVAVIDSDYNGNADLAYMGDSFGNIWKIDLKTKKFAFNDSPLFTATDKNGAPQTISAGLTVAINPADGFAWVFFGTGRYVAFEDVKAKENVYQSMYGIKDHKDEVITSRRQLEERSILNSQGSKRTITDTALLPPNKRGWFIDFTVEAERVVDTPQMISGELMVTTRQPDGSDCSPQGTGWVMMLDGFTGTRLPRQIFDVNLDGRIDDKDKLGNDIVSGYRTKTQNSKVTMGKTKDLGVVGMETANIAPTPRKFNLQLDLGRQSWSEVTR